MLVEIAPLGVDYVELINKSVDNYILLFYDLDIINILGESKVDWQIPKLEFFLIFAKIVWIKCN